MTLVPSRIARPVRAILIGGACVSGLSACITPVAERLAMLERTAVCCESLREFKYAPLSTSEEKEVTFGEDSPAFVFETGKSFFAAYRLPAWTAPYQIRAEGQAATVVKAGLFSPSALMLDGDFKITRQFNIAQDIGNARPTIVHIFVNEANKDEQYLVLFTARLSSEGVNTLMTKQMTMMIGAAPVVIGATESRVSLRHSPTGVLQLKVSPYQPIRAGQASKAD